MVAAKVESLSIAFGVDGGCFIYSHAAERVFGHGVRLFHGSLSFLSCCSARRPRVTGIRLGGRHTCLLLVVASLCGIWQQSLSMHSECQPPLTRVRCFRRAATPPHGLSEIPQGKSCAFRDKAYMCDGPLGSPASFNNLARLRKCSATPFACTVAASPSSSGRRWCPPCTSKQAPTGVCDRVRAATGATDLKLTMIVALPDHRDTRTPARSAAKS